MVTSLSSDVMPIGAVTAIAVATRVGLVDVKLEATITDDGKSLVLRLATASGYVIAKRAAREAIMRDELAFGTLLPAAGLAAPNVRGVVDDVDPALAWILVAAVDGRPYDPASRDPELLARWLARVHEHPWIAYGGLPERDEGYHLRRVLGARSTLAQRLADAEDTDDRWVIARSLALTESIERHWSHCTSLAAWLPQSVVHGDLAPENALIDHDRVFVLDWEKAAWGNPAIDIARVDTDAYARARDIDPAAITAAVRYGALVRTLSHNWAAKPLSSLARFTRRLERELASAISEVGS